MKSKLIAALLAVFILITGTACSSEEEIYMIGYVAQIATISAYSADVTVLADEENPEYAGTNVVVTVDSETKIMDKKGNIILLASIEIGTPLKVIFSQAVISASPDYGFADSIQIVELDEDYIPPQTESETASQAVTSTAS